MMSLESQGFAEIQNLLKTASQKAADLSPVNKRFGRYMKDVSIPENFRRRGRPIPWRPVTRFGEKGVDPLRDQGYLLNSVGFYTEGNDLVLGAGNHDAIRYARRQQMGGWVLPKKKFLAIPCVPPLTMSEARTTWARDWMGKGTWIMHGPDGFGVYRKGKQRTGAVLLGVGGAGKGVEMIFRLVPKVFIHARVFLLFQESDVSSYGRAVFRYLFPAAPAANSGEAVVGGA